MKLTSNQLRYRRAADPVHDVMAYVPAAAATGFRTPTTVGGGTVPPASSSDTSGGRDVDLNKSYTVDEWVTVWALLVGHQDLDRMEVMLVDGSWMSARRWAEHHSKADPPVVQVADPHPDFPVRVRRWTRSVQFVG